MQIIIPMSGFGERFRKAGYEIPKPLIEIDGKPIIAHVIDMFPGEKDFIFICNQEHLNNLSYQMQKILNEFCPTGRVIGIEPHKLGPVHAVLTIREMVNLNAPTIVNYCDFTCIWDWKHFNQFVKENRCQGVIPAYKGFHPHTLGSTNYAYMIESGGWVGDIQEKKPYTNNRMQEYASSGTYYFESGKLMLEAFDSVIAANQNVNGEYYVSLAYKYLLNNNMRVAAYELQHFMQWGTPEDVSEYLGWSNAFRQLIKNSNNNWIKPIGSLVLPMAGLGQRFVQEGYSLTKPLIPVSGRPMVEQAAHDLPASMLQAFVLRRDMPGHDEIVTELTGLYPEAVIESIPRVTEGQACTALMGLDALERNNNTAPAPITVGACDNGALYDPIKLQHLINDPGVDVVVWGVRGHANAIRKPQMFGWIDATTDGAIRIISVKSPLSNPHQDAIVIGTFTFRNSQIFRLCLQKLIQRNGRVNNEFYIDSMINDAIELGFNCRLFEVDSYLSWGTPDDLRTFEYWQSCFHKWESHPYRLEKDSRIPVGAQKELEEKYAPIKPSISKE